jgi:uncharacterized cupredoxin-like copper-binding protein
MRKQPATRTITASVLSLVLGAVAGLAGAHGSGGHPVASPTAAAAAHAYAFGKQGTARKATRTITIDMHDSMRFGPADIAVREGDTVRFVVVNQGAMMHEMVLGTMEELKSHGETMRKHPGMAHDAPYMAHVSPGKKAELVWQFTKAGEYYYACLIPGHFEAGMVGRIRVTKG